MNNDFAIILLKKKTQLNTHLNINKRVLFGLFTSLLEM